MLSPEESINLIRPHFNAREDSRERRELRNHKPKFEIPRQRQSEIDSQHVFSLEYTDDEINPLIEDNADVAMPLYPLFKAKLNLMKHRIQADISPSMR
jgi:hypothetical protein